MAILAECDICGNQHRVKDGLVGNAICCKECGVQIVVPEDSVIAQETFIDEEGRLRRREPEQQVSLWSWLLVVLFAIMVFLILCGVIWMFTALVRPVPK